MVDTGTSRRADVFVVFGITGDLAKQMTLHSLYRLEARGLLRCPILGVAVDDWSVDDLRERARQAILASGERLDPEIFARFTARLSYLAGDFADPATFERLAAALKDMRGDSPRFKRQDGVEEAWRVMQPLVDAPSQTHPYAKGSWGPEEANRLPSGHGRWHNPWVST
jgi:glucose-6-phosphate 1-dehydrogenase